MDEYFPDKKWIEKSCDSLNLDKKVLDDLTNIIPLEYENTEGIIILKKGYIVYENYFKKTVLIQD